jgi:hypothetical protein
MLLTKDAPHLRAPTFPLRLPASLRTAVDRLAKDEGTSADQFIAMAVAEMSALATAEEFERRTKAADLDALDQIISRETGSPELEAGRLD